MQCHRMPNKKDKERKKEEFITCNIVTMVIIKKNISLNYHTHLYEVNIINITKGFDALPLY